MTPQQIEEMARKIVSRTDDSYMAFNKNAKYGLNHNTCIWLLEDIVKAITQAINETWEEAAQMLEDYDRDYVIPADAAETIRARKIKL